MIKNISILDQTLLSDHHFILKKVEYQYSVPANAINTATREVYDRGDGAVLLLYNIPTRSVILTKQFRLPTYLNGNTSGHLIEACAGMLDDDNPEDCIRREAQEETDFCLNYVEKIYQAYMSPGAVTEILHFFIAPYDSDMRTSDGGGLAQEGEYIEVLELNFDTAYNMIYNAEIQDAKTIMLLQYAKTYLYS